jgi:MFS family permease
MTHHRRSTSGGLALWGAAVAFASLYVAAGAVMPLLVVYQEQWNLSAASVTLTFAVFAAGFLAGLLIMGSLSDHVGRRPVLIGALGVQVASNLVFTFAPDVGWVIIGRVVQGLATGAATTAFTATLVELAPPSRRRLGTIAGSVGLTGGLALGSMLAGLTIQLTTHANTVVFVVMTIVTVMGIAVVAMLPETVTPRPGALRSLLPRIAVPPATRTEFAAAAPAIAAVWMLSGLTGGLAPSMVRSVFMLDSPLLNGLSGFVSPAASAVVGLAVIRIDPRRSMVVGVQACLVGAVGIAVGAVSGSLVTMIVGQAVSGAAFGAAFTAALTLTVPLAQAHRRAAVAAAIYLVSYTAFGIPIVIAGHLAGRLGLVPTVVGYAAVTAVLALCSLLAQLRLGRRSSRTLVVTSR